MGMDRDITDAQLVHAILRGRHDAFATLVNRYYTAAKAYAAVAVHDESNAEDVVQEAFLRAYRSLDTLKDPVKFPAWLFTIVRNTAHTMRDAAARNSVRTDSREAATLPNPERDELHEILRSEIAALDERHREVIALHYFAGKTTSEIAALLGIRSYAAQKRLQRARRALGEKLLDRLGGEVRPYETSQSHVSRVLAAASAVQPDWKLTAPGAAAGLAAAGWMTALYKITLLLILILGGLLTFFHYQAGQKLKSTGVIPPHSGASSAPEQQEPNAIAASAGADAPAETDTASEWINAEETPSIWGVVTDTNGKAVPDVQIKTIVAGESRYVMTDSDGAYAFRGLPADEYMLRAVHDAHRTTTIPFVLTGSVYNIVLVPTPMIDGRVVRADTGEAIPVYDLHCFTGAKSKTLNGGRFRLYGIEGHEVRIIVKAPGFARFTGALPVPPAGAAEKEIEVSLTPIPVIRGTLVDAQGNGVEGATLHEMYGPDQRLLAETAPDGAFVVDSLEYIDGRFAQGDFPVTNLSVRHDDYASLIVGIPRPQDGEDAYIRAVLSAGGTVMGHVQIAVPDGDEEALVPHSVSITDSQQGTAEVSLDGGNNYIIHHVAEGLVSVTLDMTRGESRTSSEDAFFTREAEVTQGRVTHVDFEMEQWASLEGAAMWGTTPLQVLANVFVTTDGGEFRQRTAAANGAYRIDRLPPGDAIVEFFLWQGGLHAQPQIEVTIAPGQALQHDVIFPVENLIQGVVTGRRPDERVNLLLIQGGPLDGDEHVRGPIVANTEPDGTGNFSLPAMPGSVYTLLVSARCLDTERTAVPQMMGSVRVATGPPARIAPILPLQTSEPGVRKTYYVVDLTNGEPVSLELQPPRPVAN